MGWYSFPNWIKYDSIVAQNGTNRLCLELKFLKLSWVKLSCYGLGRSLLNYSHIIAKGQKYQFKGSKIQTLTCKRPIVWVGPMADEPKSLKLKNAFFWEDFNPLWLREDILSSWTIAHDTPTYILENNRSAELLSDANIWKYFSPVSIF